MVKPIVVVPARMASQRLPGKPLADIGGAPMIVRVLEVAAQAGVGPVLAAVAEQEVYDVVVQAGGRAVMTDPDLASGSDRVKAAVDAVDPEGVHDIVVNLQGDMPTLDPADLARAVEALTAAPDADAATLITATEDPKECADPNVVKAIKAHAAPGAPARILYFTRAAAPSGPGPLWHHVGVYAYRRSALDRFTALAPSPLEQRERLEQLRLLENGMIIVAHEITSSPLGVDTPADLEEARRLLSR